MPGTCFKYQGPCIKEMKDQQHFTVVEEDHILLRDKRQVSGKQICWLWWQILSAHLILIFLFCMIHLLCPKLIYYWFVIMGNSHLQLAGRFSGGKCGAACILASDSTAVQLWKLVWTIEFSILGIIYLFIYLKLEFLAHNGNEDTSGNLHGEIQEAQRELIRTTKSGISGLA